MRKIKVGILFIIMCVCMLFGFACGGSSGSGSSKLESITVSDYKAEFEYGEAFSVGDLVVTANYENGSTKVVTDYSVNSNAYNANRAGKYNISITYEEDGVSVKKGYFVTVTESKTVAALVLEGQTTEFAYKQDYYFSGTVHQQYADGRLVAVETGYEVDSSAYNATVAGAYQIKVSYQGVDAYYTVNVMQSMVAKDITVSGQKTSFAFAEDFVFDGTISVEYEDGRTEAATANYTVDDSAYDSFAVGTHSIKLSIGGMEYSYDVSVAKATRIKLLMIGNSFSQDTVTWMGQIAKSAGYTDILIGNLVIGGCDIETHYGNALSNERKYTFDYYENGVWKQKNSQSMKDGITYANWDFISLQQVSGKSGLKDTYNSALTKWATYVVETATNENVKLLWNMTWAYQTGSTHTDFPSYNSNQMKMYSMIVDAVQSKILTNDQFAAVSPAGTAIQNARTSYIGDNWTRDGYHLSESRGRFVSGLTMFCLITGASPYDVTFRPTVGGVEMTEKELQVAQESVANAMANKFAVTNSKITA